LKGENMGIEERTDIIINFGGEDIRLEFHKEHELENFKEFLENKQKTVYRYDKNDREMYFYKDKIAYYSIEKVNTQHEKKLLFCYNKIDNKYILFSCINSSDKMQNKNSNIIKYNEKIAEEIYFVIDKNELNDFYINISFEENEIYNIKKVEKIILERCSKKNDIEYFKNKVSEPHDSYGYCKEEILS